MDSYYTPPTLADLVVSSSRIVAPKKIVDFAAGDGALLKSALVRWPGAEITAMDVDKAAIRALATGIPHATLQHEDFFCFSDGLGQAKNQKAKILFDVILLNPPFSRQGSTTIPSEINGRIVRGSRALSFVARALAYLSYDGELIAILPSSCFTSERDVSLRAALKENWDIQPIGRSRSSAFPRCSVTIDLVRVSRRILGTIEDPIPPTRGTDISRGRLLVMRGTVANSDGSTVPEGLQLVHTTDLVNGAVAQATRWTTVRGRTVSGTALLLPRVGRMTIGKVVLKNDPTPVALSDCVMALKTPDRNDESALQELICRKWETFSSLWAGSCATYVTLRWIACALGQLGYEVGQVSDMAVDSRKRGARIDERRRTPRGEIRLSARA